MSRSKLTQKCFYVHNSLLTFDLKGTDTDVAILGMYFQSILNGKIYLQYGTSSSTTLYDLSENSLDSLVQALPGLHAFSGCDTTSCFEGNGNLKKHNIFSGTGFARYFKFFPTKTVLIDKIHNQSKVENTLTNVQCVSFIIS